MLSIKYHSPCQVNKEVGLGYLERILKRRKRRLHGSKSRNRSMQPVPKTKALLQKLAISQITKELCKKNLNLKNWKVLFKFVAYKYISMKSGNFWRSGKFALLTFRKEELQYTVVNTVVFKMARLGWMSSSRLWDRLNRIVLATLAGKVEIVYLMLPNFLQ